MKSKPKDLVVELPILRIIPIETCHLRLQVWIKLSTHLCILYDLDMFFLSVCHFLVFWTPEYIEDTSVHNVDAKECDGCGVSI